MNDVLAPPSSIEAERELIGTLLALYKPQLVHIAETTGLTPRDFYWKQHEAMYRAVLQVHARGEHVDTMTVARFLSSQLHETDGSWLEAVGGRAQVEGLACFTVTYGFRERCAIVHQDGQWRRWLCALYEAEESIHDRNSERFWAAIARVREDILPGELHVVQGEGRAA
jgi:replicative DNA helicase